MAVRKTINELLDVFLKAGKKRRETIALNAGFETADEYEAHLRAKLPVATTNKTVVHNVVILDASGSMSGHKFNNAVEAINSEVKILKTDTNVDYKYSRFIFSGIGNEGQIYGVQLENVPDINHIANNGTPLFITISAVIQKLKTFVLEGEKVIINIFTDGDDTSGELQDAKINVDLAKSKGWTITFVGTSHDVKKMINAFNLDESNTLVHNNTAESVKRSLNTTTYAKLAYSQAVADGASDLELQSNFYKREGKL